MKTFTNATACPFKEASEALLEPIGDGSADPAALKLEGPHGTIYASVYEVTRGGGAAYVHFAFSEAPDSILGMMVYNIEPNSPDDMARVDATPDQEHAENELSHLRDLINKADDDSDAEWSKIFTFARDCMNDYVEGVNRQRREG